MLASHDTSPQHTATGNDVPGSKPQNPLTVWFGPMPESNGKTNWTAVLMPKGGRIWDGITLDRSEFKDRVRYTADRVRYLLGEYEEEPDLLAYDENLQEHLVQDASEHDLASTELAKVLQPFATAAAFFHGLRGNKGLMLRAAGSGTNYHDMFRVDDLRDAQKAHAWLEGLR